MTDAPAPPPYSNYIIIYDVYLEDGLVAPIHALVDHEEDEDAAAELIDATEDAIHSQSSAYDPLPPFESLDRSTWIDDSAYHEAYHLLKHSDLRDMATNPNEKHKVRMALLYALDELTS